MPTSIGKDFRLRRTIQSTHRLIASTILRYPTLATKHNRPRSALSCTSLCAEVFWSLGSISFARLSFGLKLHPRQTFGLSAFFKFVFNCGKPSGAIGKLRALGFKFLTSATKRGVLAL